MNNRIRQFFPIFLIILITLIIFGGVFTSGKIFLGNFDRLENTVPFKLISLRAFQAGRIPQWNPYIFCGLSYLGGGVVHFFYPFETVLYFFNEDKLPFLLTISIILHMLFAGIFSFIFLKELIKDRFWACISTIAYLLSTTLIFNLRAGVRDYSVFTYLPILLYLITTFKRRSVKVNVLLLAACVYLLFSGGGLQMSVYAVCFCSAYFLFENINIEAPNINKKRSLFNIPFTFKFMWKNISVYLFSVILGITLCSVFIAPLLSESKTTPKDEITDPNYMNYSEVLGVDILRLFSHKFSNRKTNPPDTILTGKRKKLYIYNQYNIFNCYVGLLPIIFALYAVIYIRKRETIFWSASIFIILLSVMGSPISRFVYLAHKSEELLFYRIVWFLPVIFSVLFGIAGREVSRNKSKLKSLTKFSLIVFALVFFAMQFIYIKALNSGVDPDARHILKDGMIHFIIFSCLTAIILLSVRKIGFSLLVKTALFLVVFSDLYAAADFEMNRGYVPFLCNPPFFKEFDQWKNTKGFFERSNFQGRASVGTDLIPTSQTIASGIYNSSGYASISPYYVCRIYQFPFIRGRIKRRSAWPNSKRAVELSSTFLFIKDNVVIQSDEEALTRISCFTDYEVYPEYDYALLRLMSPSFDIHEKIILSEEPKLKISKTNLSKACLIEKNDPEHLEIRAFVSANCLMLLTDTYHQGWKAFIDGEETHILKANTAFRAIELPAGEHKIEFVFEQPWLRGGIILSIISAGIFIVIMLLVLKNRSMKENR